MSGDIKEIVNNLNKANSKKDSDDDVSCSFEWTTLKYDCLIIGISISVGYYLSNFKLSYDSVAVYWAQCWKFEFNG